MNPVSYANIKLKWKSDISTQELKIYITNIYLIKLLTADLLYRAVIYRQNKVWTGKFCTAFFLNYFLTYLMQKYNTAIRGQYSQSKKVRTFAATFRASSLEILKNLAVGAVSGGTHFVRCIRSDLEGQPRGFHREVVRQQIRALAVLDTARARQRGYPFRISFQEFLKRFVFVYLMDF